MKKSKLLFCTKLRMFLSVIPLAFLLILSIIYNDKVEGLLGLWPLIIAVSGFIVFIFLYFFRAISVSAEEIRAIGLFSSRDFRTVEKDKTIVLTLRSKGRLRVELFGKDTKPAFDWIKDKNISDEDVNLFSERAVGGEGSVKRILKLFGVSNVDFDKIFSPEFFEKDYDSVRVTTEVVNEEKKVKIKFLETL